MDVRPLFWMMAGAGATLVAGAWGDRQFLPIPGESQQAVPMKTAVLLDVAVKRHSDSTGENALRRTPWVEPKADPFGEQPAVVPRVVTPAPVVENREPPPLVFPFEYVGKLTADGKETLFLSKGDQIYPVAESETLESVYRVEHIGSDAIEVSYLPDARKMNITLDTITAKHVSGAAMPPSGLMGSMAPPPADFFGGGGAPQPIMIQPPVEQKEVTADVQQMMVPPIAAPADEGQQSTPVPVSSSLPPGMLHPGRMPPGMMPPGMVLPGVQQ